MRAQEFGRPVRSKDGAHRRPVSRVRLKHLLNQILQLVGQMIGEGRVCPPAHLKDQALPA